MRLMGGRLLLLEACQRVSQGILTFYFRLWLIKNKFERVFWRIGRHNIKCLHENIAVFYELLRGI